MNLNLPITEDCHDSEMSLAAPFQDVQELTEMFETFGNKNEESADNHPMTSHQRESSHGILGKNKKRNNSCSMQKLKQSRSRLISKRHRKVLSHAKTQKENRESRSSSRASSKRSNKGGSKRASSKRKEPAFYNVRVPHE